MPRTLKDAIIQAFIADAAKKWLQSLKGNLKAMAILSGYRTYIIIGALVILNVLHYVGIDVPGFTSTSDIGNLIGTIMALWAARAGARNDAAKALLASGTVPETVQSDNPVGAAKTVIANAGK